MNNEALSEKYFSMPSDVGTATNGAFKYLKDRVWSRVEGWLEQCLPAGGKEILIKAVAQAIPTYSMSCFKLPKGLCEHLTSSLRNFWWGYKDDKRKTGWVTWGQMVKPKSIDGLGFHDMELFNHALLTKQASRILQKPSSLSARVLKAVYYPGGKFLEAELGSSPSRVGPSIVDDREVLQEGLIRHISTGETTTIWTTNWLPSDSITALH